jgi:diguanylate cyclase (GGDEF)-like protein
LPVRVVLVGQTGLDLPLRLDPSIELRRVPTAVHAIGEAAEPLVVTEEGQEGAVTVILSPETDPRVDAGDFLQNLRQVRPSARVLRLLSSDETTGAKTAAGEYDGTIRFGTPPDEIRRLVREIHTQGAAGFAAAPGVPAPSARVQVEIKETAGEASAPGVSPVAGECGPGEGVLVQALLVGRDVVLPALDLIRRRLGRPDVSFDESAASAATGTPVRCQGVTYGSLMSATASEEELKGHAQWLGQWMALKQQQDELRQAAFTDDLTGAWNRRYCERFLGTAIAQAAANRSSVTVMFFDIDDFKQYNDKFGHAAGDDILRETVKLLKSVIRPTDRVCRVGGDEFVVIFHEPQGPREAGSKPPGNIGDIAARFQRQICEHRFPKLAEKAPGTLTISGGLATFPWDGRSTQELIERADQLAIQSKLQGKNAITFGPGTNRVCGRG